MKIKILFIGMMVISSLKLYAQTIMNIHQSNGTVLHIPLNTIDSITYTINYPGNLATISTLPIGNITSTSASSGGNITNNGGTTVTQRGIVWSTTPNPTTANNSTSDGSGAGSYNSNLTGLTANTTYYVRAYATNSAGTAYGNELSFRTTSGGSGNYPPGSVFCNGIPTAIVDVTNPATGKTWMDMNLGASRAATSSTDTESYGDLYQWGRRADGHQCRNSATTTTLSSTNTPAHGSFILAPNSPFDWRSPQNTNLWQGVNGVNNPCPTGYRIPTEAELNAERLSWSSNNNAGAFASPLKLPVAGYRNLSSGSLSNVGTFGYYWSSTVSSADSRNLFFNSSLANMYPANRARGNSVRCLKDG
jgi:uncharacterized protein (TIGR02145 family)